VTFPPVQRSDWLQMPAGVEPLPDGTVTSAPGFEASGVACGVKPSGALDLGLLVSRRRAVSALVDTRNALPAAPVLRNRGLDTSRFQAVVVNAGTANAATGSPGVEDAAWMAERAAARLGLAAEEVAVSSTGTIGERIERERIARGIDGAAAALAPDRGGDFAAAITTTDRFLKHGAFRVPLPSGAVTVGAAAKGAGMISPRMATMLAYVATDAALDAETLARITREAADASFNRITVDGQMSPSDTLIVLANGAGAPLRGDDLAGFAAALTAVCRWLAVQIVRDGEGAEHAVRLLVRGARDDEEADAVARAVGNSPLVKTAVFGRDPNWGRVVQAVGQALSGRPGPPAEPGLRVDGLPPGDPRVADVMSLPEYEIELALGRGEGTAELFFSDLTHAYVALNAEYHT